MAVTIETPMEVQSARAVLSQLFNAPDGLTAGELRKIALLSGKVKESTRDAVLESLRTLQAIEPYGGSGRGRSYKITPIGQRLHDSFSTFYST